MEPTVSYGADEVHLFHYIRDPKSQEGGVYGEFYKEVCSQIKDKLPKARIVVLSPARGFDTYHGPSESFCLPGPRT